MHFTALETDRLWLKNIALEDRAFLLEQFSNGDVNRFLFDVEPLSSLQAAEDIIRFYLQPEPRAQHRWILTRKADGERLGTCGYHCWDREKGTCEVGYDLYPDFWGQGYMGEALRAILAFARDEMKVQRVNACVYPDNEKSVHTVERLGFVFAGAMKDEIFRGETYPHRIYSLDFTISQSMQ